MKAKLLIILIAVLAAASNLHAVATTVGDILDVVVGGRAAGMAGAYTAAGNDVESAIYNPAGIEEITKKQIQYMYWISYADVGVNNVSYAQPLENFIVDGNVALSGVYRNMPLISNENAVDQPVNYYDFVLDGTYANKLSYFLPGEFYKNFNVGMNLKIIYENIGIYPLTAYAVDLGTQFTPPDSNFRLGAVIQNLGFPVKVINDQEPLPLTLRAGASYKIEFQKNNQLLIDVDYIQDFYDSGQIAIGFEEMMAKMFYIRAGYDQNMDFKSASYISLGLGISISQFQIATFSVNYDYRPVLWNGFTLFDSTHVLSLEIQI